MVVAVTDEQHALTAAVAALAERHAAPSATRAVLDELAAGTPVQVWNVLVQSGFPAVHLPDDCGGAGGGLIEAGCVADGAGYGLLPGPLLPTMITAAQAAAAQPGPGRRDLLADVAAGLPAATAGPDVAAVRLTHTPDGPRLTGTVGPTLGLCAAHRLLLAARTGDDAVVWVVLHTAGCDVTAEPGTDLTRDVGTLELADHPVDPANIVDGLTPGHARELAVALLSAEGAGIARWCVDNVLAHLKSREQFGRPIGAFQALQHRAVDMFVQTQLLESTAILACVRADEPDADARQRAVSIAKARLTAGGKFVAQQSVQLHGGIGITDEHDVGLYFKRMQVLATLFGDEDFHLARFAAREAFARTVGE